MHDPTTASITFDIPIDIPAESPAVSDKILNKAQQLLPGTKRVSIKWERSPGRWQQINSFAVPPGAHKNQPGVDADEVASKIMIAIDAFHMSLSKGDDPVQPQNYRVMFARDGVVDGPVRPSFEYLYDPLGESSSASQPDDAQVNSTIAQYQALTTTLLDTVAKLSGEMSKSQQLLVSIANSNQQGMKPLADMSGYMGQMFISGHAMLMNGMNMIFDHKKAEAESRASTKKFEMLVRQFSGPVKAFIQHKGWQMEGNPDDDEEQPDDDEGGESSSAPDIGTGASVTPTDDEIDPRVRADPFAAYIRILGESIKPSQWMKVRKSFTAKEFELFAAFLEVPTDAEAIRLFDAIWHDGGIAPTKLLALAGELSEETRSQLMRLDEMCESARARYES